MPTMWFFPSLKVLVISTVLAGQIAVPAWAQSSPPDLKSQEAALNLIADFSEKICLSFPVSGASQDTQLSAEANAELLGVIKKLVNIGIRGAAKYQNSEYRGLLQQDLAKFLGERAKCKLQIWSDLRDRFIPTAAPVQPTSAPTRVITPSMLLLRQARLLRSPSNSVSLLEIIVENPTVKSAILSEVLVEATQPAGFACDRPTPPAPWQTVQLKWDGIVSSVSDDAVSAWTTVIEEPVRVDASYQRATCGNYRSTLRLEIPISYEAVPLALTRINLKIVEDLPDHLNVRLQVAWRTIKVSVKATNTVRPDQLLVDQR